MYKINNFVLKFLIKYEKINIQILKFNKSKKT